MLFELRDEAGFDHLSCVIAQEYHDRYESIYHLTEYDRRTREVSVVVPSPTDDPRNESAAPVYSTAGWHEREATTWSASSTRATPTSGGTTPTPHAGTVRSPRFAVGLGRPGTAPAGWIGRCSVHAACRWTAVNCVYL